jgi:hypothetical protein
LFLPRGRQHLCQAFQLRRLGLSAVEDGFDEVRREQRQPQRPIYEAYGAALGFGDLSRRTLSG